jgi:SecD/SecF fusion protein
VPVATLYFFGGDTLKDFAFALLVGIGFGAYSSVFLAAPLVAVFKEREPEFRRRRDDLGALEGIESVGGALLDQIEDERGPSDDDEPGTQPARRPSPAPTPASAAATAGSSTTPTESKRERRRQRRASRPHGRAR